MRDDSNMNWPIILFCILGLAIAIPLILYMHNTGWVVSGKSPSHRGIGSTESEYIVYYNNVYCCSVDSYYVGDVVGSRVKCIPLQPILSKIGYTISSSESNKTAQVISPNGDTYILSQNSGQIYFDEGMLVAPLSTFSDVLGLNVQVNTSRKYIYLST